MSTESSIADPSPHNASEHTVITARCDPQMPATECATDTDDDEDDDRRTFSQILETIMPETRSEHTEPPPMHPPPMDDVVPGPGLEPVLFDIEHMIDGCSTYYKSLTPNGKRATSIFVNGIVTYLLASLIITEPGSIGSVVIGMCGAAGTSYYIG